MTLTVSEVFGPTFQGEGPTLGTPCAFLRLGGCNLHCIWCDTPYTWRFSDMYPHEGNKVYDARKELKNMSWEEAAHDVIAHLGNADLLVISGGEPMLQQAGLAPLIEKMQERGIAVEFETAGTIAPLYEVLRPNVKFNVSPKLAHSQNDLVSRYKPAALEALQATGAVQAWKFVATRPQDLSEVDALVTAHKLSPVFIMPEGISPDAMTGHAQALANAVIERGWNLTTRLQIQLYGNKRGV